MMTPTHNFQNFTYILSTDIYALTAGAATDAADVLGAIIDRLNYNELDFAVHYALSNQASTSTTTFSATIRTSENSDMSTSVTLATIAAETITAAFTAAVEDGLLTYHIQLQSARRYLRIVSNLNMAETGTATGTYEITAILACPVELPTTNADSSTVTIA
jgi:hypothetical protein